MKTDVMCFNVSSSIVTVLFLSFALSLSLSLCLSPARSGPFFSLRDRVDTKGRAETVGAAVAIRSLFIGCSDARN